MSKQDIVSKHLLQMIIYMCNTLAPTTVTLTSVNQHNLQQFPYIRKQQVLVSFIIHAKLQIRKQTGKFNFSVDTILSCAAVAAAAQDSFVV